MVLQPQNDAMEISDRDVEQLLVRKWAAAVPHAKQHCCREQLWLLDAQQAGGVPCRMFDSAPATTETALSQPCSHAAP